MNTAVNYILESGVSLAFLSIIYVLFLRKETFFRLNRIFLLGSVFFSVILPFLKFKIYAPDPVVLEEITVMPYRNLIEAVTVYGHDLSGSLEKAIVSANFVILVYLGGGLFFLFRFLFRFGQIYHLIKNNKVQKSEGFSLIVLEKDFSPFSFLNYIFVSNSVQKSEGYRKMIIHEMEHIRQGHSFDVIILELLTVFQWLNPFMWILRYAIRENHEFLADQAVLKSGINRSYYKRLLLNQFVGLQFELSNSFNYSLIKKRIKMMSRIRSSGLANIKVILGVIAASSLVLIFACEQKETFEMKTIQNDQELKVTFLDEKLKIEGAVENLEKIKKLFSQNPCFQKKAF